MGSKPKLELNHQFIIGENIALEEDILHNMAKKNNYQNLILILKIQFHKTIFITQK